MGNSNRSSLLAAALLSVGLLAGGAASARNDKLLLPVEPALRSGGIVPAPRGDVPVHFGAASDVTGDAALGIVNAHGVMDPSAPGNNDNGGKRDRRPDRDVCQDAFRKAVAELQQRARNLGGVAVVGIVGNYHGTVFDSRDQYECHVGFTRAVVDLRGQAARAVPAAAR